MEYLTPVIEPAEIYEAKSGEDIARKELFTFFDKSGRKLALRPEMTPSVTRMVSRIYKTWKKPIKLFSIANFFRYERPQKGRTREFWQLNADIFGKGVLNEDIEVLSLAVELMLSFNPPKNSFVINISSRKLIDDFFEFLEIEKEKRTEISRTMDKFKKLSSKDFETELKKTLITDEQIQNILNFLISNKNSFKNYFPALSDKQSFKELETVFEELSKKGFSDWIKFSPDTVRGIDYYDGIIFEVFDTNPENPRSMFGGGRYNGLGSLFGIKNMPATGFAPGNVTTRLFLEGWNLV